MCYNPLRNNTCFVPGHLRGLWLAGQCPGVGLDALLVLAAEADVEPVVTRSGELPVRAHIASERSLGRRDADCAGGLRSHDHGRGRVNQQSAVRNIAMGSLPWQHNILRAAVPSCRQRAGH